MNRDLTSALVLPLLLTGAGCVWESVVREPDGVHHDRHHGDVPLSEQERFEAERRSRQSTPLGAEEAGFVKRFLDRQRFLKVYYVRRGAGEGHPALIMLGGLDDFEPLGRRLESACDVIYLQPALESLKLSDRIADIEALRKNLMLERIHLYGVGEWATLALEYAAAHPERTAGVLWVAGEIDTQARIRQALTALAEHAADESQRARLESLAAREPLGLLEYLRSLEADLHVPACRQFEPCRREHHRVRDSLKTFSYPKPAPEERPADDYWLFSFVTPDLRGRSRLQYCSKAAAEALRGLRIQMLQGRWDAITPPGRAEELKRHLPDAGLEILHGSAHRPDLEEPAAVLGRVAVFIGVSPLPPPSKSPLDVDWRPAYDDGDCSPGELKRRAEAEDVAQRKARVTAGLTRACAALESAELVAQLGLDAGELEDFRSEVCARYPGH